MRRGLLPRLQDFLFVLVLAGALVTGSRMLNTDSDLGRHLALGGYILSSHTIPTQDLFSFTRFGEPRPPYEWLAQVLLALSRRILGLDGVVMLTSLVIALAFSVVYLDSVHRSRAPILALLIVALAAVASSLHWLARPHVFSFLYFSLWLGGLERLRRRERIPLWFFPALMLLWANTHGGFIVGFLAIGAYLVGWFLDALRASTDRVLGRRLLIAGLASGLASIVTPDLWHNWDAVLNNRSSFVLSRTVETMPLQFSSPGVWPFLAMLALALVLLVLQRFRVPASQLVLLLLLAVASFAMVRNIPLFAIAVAPLLSDWVAKLLGGVALWRRVEDRFEQMDAELRPYIWSGMAVALAFCFFAYQDIGLRASVFGFRSDVFPVRAADWVTAHPQSGRMFNDFNWGGYLLYRLWPEQKVFIDSQSDFYGESLTRQSVSIEGADSGWESVLDQYGVNWLLIPRGAPLALAASANSRWGVVYQDDISVVLVRK